MTSPGAKPGRIGSRVRAVRRRASRAWRLVRAAVVDPRTTRAHLARELGVTSSQLDGCVRAWRQSLATSLPCGPADRDAIAHALTVHAPDQLATLGRAAEAAANRTIDLLGSGPVHVGHPVDWHRDFKSGRRWPADRHCVRIVLDDVPGADVKVPWELSRCQHLPWLAQSALLSARDDHAREAAAQMREWIAGNPLEYGVNWVCAMDVGLRAINWIWTAALLARHEAIDDAFYAELMASLIDHGTFIAENLEEHSDGVRTNHYVADVLGMLYIGACLPQSPRASAWRAFSREALAREIQTQVLPDGASFESSIPYHRLVAEMFLSAALLERHQARPFAEPYLLRLEAMIEFTAAYTKPDGHAPQVGDADDGRVHVLSGHDADPRDHRHVLAAGAMLFGRDDWWRASGPRWTEALWLGGARDARRVEPPARHLPQVASRSFPDAGIHILRHGADMVILTAGRVGTAGLGNHKHNDLLAIEVQLAGEDVLVDAGTYLYTADPAARDAFRSTAAHNTVIIDGVEQNEIPKGVLFALHSNATPRLVAWEPTDTGGTVVAEHDGYGRLPAPVIHRRAVTLEPHGAVRIQDALEGAPTAAHRFTWTFTFAPGCGVEKPNADWLVTLPSGRALRFRRTMTGVAPVAEAVAGFVSPRYGVRVPVSVLRWTYEGLAPAAVGFTLEPV